MKSIDALLFLIVSTAPLNTAAFHVPSRRTNAAAVASRGCDPASFRSRLCVGGVVPPSSLGMSSDEGGDDEAAPPPPPQFARPSDPVVRRPLDPLMATLTRIDDVDAPIVDAPLIGEVPADGSLNLVAFAVTFAALGFVLSIVVAFNSRDEIWREYNKVSLPKMEYTPTKVVEGECRGLCSSQEESLEGMRGFMESLSRNKNQVAVEVIEASPVSSKASPTSGEVAPATSDPVGVISSE